jgi:tetratricopeptide (TPR) repeat protein
VSYSLVNLGCCLLDLGQPEPARDLFARAQEIDETAYGPDHPEVAADLVNLGQALRDLGESRSAREVLERSLTIRERVYGSDHLYVLHSIVALWDLFDESGDETERTAGLATRARGLAQGSSGSFNSKILSCLADVTAMRSRIEAG